MARLSDSTYVSWTPLLLALSSLDQCLGASLSRRASVGYSLAQRPAVDAPHPA